ncbi:MAG: DUF1549 domain-containing protein [Planctomycetaceae bacterium]|nr:DUF1549 domain-containing protein [Planctomycetaceae bacterium]
MIAFAPSRVLPTFLLGLMMVGRLSAQEVALHELINQHLTPVAGLDPGLCSDAEFARRVTIDLTGMPPTADETRSFLADSDSQKRIALVDRLLASPQFDRQLVWMLDLMLMERRAYTNVSADDWHAWLLKSVQANRPWNLLARDILLADGDDLAQRSAARFALDRGSEPNLLTRDMGRIFFGKDFQCAQCHDHPLVSDYLQSDYHGLLAFLAPGYQVTKSEGDQQINLYAEKAGTDLTFESVFIKGTQHRTGPRLPSGVTIEEPFSFPGEEYDVAPADGVKSIPKFSRRRKLAELATSGANEAFNRNMANRLWAHMLGRGLVEPLDMHHADNPPTDPALLELLATRFVAMNFDMRAFLKEIALSKVYQRPFDSPADVTPLAARAKVELDHLEQQKTALEVASKTSQDAYANATEAWRQASAEMFPVAGEVDTARNQYVEAKKKVDEAAKALADAQIAQQSKQDVANTVAAALTAAQAAVQAISEDKELAEAAQKFANKSDQLNAEVATLAKTVEEKQTALVGPTEAMSAQRSIVEGHVETLRPLTGAMIQTEATMVAARRQAARDQQTLDAIEEQVKTLRVIIQISELDQSVSVAQQALTAKSNELATLNAQLAEYASVVDTSEIDLKSATEERSVASTAATRARMEHEKQSRGANSIATALASAEIARQQFPEDAVLGDVVAKLTERNGTAQAKVSESQQVLNTAIAVEQEAVNKLAAMQQRHEKVRAEQARRQQLATTAQSALESAQTEVSIRQSSLAAAYSDVQSRLTSDMTLSALKPLSPEQLCWSVFQVTGVYGRYWQAEVAELDKTAPLTTEQQADSAAVVARQRELEQRVYDKLKSNIGLFGAYYAASAGQPQGEFFATADQALFAANQGAINSWVAPAGGNVTERVINQTDAAIAAEELYLGILSRMPTPEESTYVAEHLSQRSDDRSVAAQELVWGLLNSAEFRFNH